MNEKLKSPIIVGHSEDEELDPAGVVSPETAKDLYVALYTDWTDADIVLERMGYALEQDGVLIPMSDRIEQAVKDAKNTTD